MRDFLPVDSYRRNTGMGPVENHPLQKRFAQELAIDLEKTDCAANLIQS